MLGGYRQLVRNIDRERKLVRSPWGRTFHFNELDRVLPSDFMFMKHNYADKIMSLDLSVQEEAVLRAIVITSTGISTFTVC